MWQTLRECVGRNGLKILSQKGKALQVGAVNKLCDKRFGSACGQFFRGNSPRENFEGGDIINNLISNYIKNDGPEKSIDIYYTEKIKATEKIRIDITKETGPVKKLDLALLCIYFLTGDVAFYNTNIKQINKNAS